MIFSMCHFSETDFQNNYINFMSNMRQTAMIMEMYHEYIISKLITDPIDKINYPVRKHI